MLGRISLSVVFLLCISAAFALDIARESRPCAQIVVENSNANAMLAARDLQFFVEKISGAKLDIVNAPQNNGLNAIYVGASRHARKLGYALPQFNGSGYDILIGENYAVLAGSNWHAACNCRNMDAIVSGCNDNGDMHAVSAFLEMLGVRFYAPGDEGTVIPTSNSISLNPGRYTREAAFSRREYFAKNGFDESIRKWFSRLKCGGRVPAVYGHTLANVLKSNKAQKSWLAEEEEGRLFPEACIPRYSDPSFQNACVLWARNFFNAHPEVKQFSLGAPEAGHCLYDWRDKAKYMTLGVSESQSYANMLLDFYGTVAAELKKSHPDRYLIWHSFNSSDVPSQLQKQTLPDNVAWSMDEISPTLYILPLSSEKYLNKLRSLSGKTEPRPKSLQKENWRDFEENPYFTFPEFFPSALQKMRNAQKDCIDGICAVLPTNGTSISKLPLLHFMLYVNSKLLWNPELDLNALQAEFYDLWFGPAAKDMQDFYSCCEQIWCRPASKAVAVQKGFFSPEDVANMFAILEQARKNVPPESVYCRRINAIAAEIEGLKSHFTKNAATGQWTEANILRADSIADGDFTKYKNKWYELKPVAPGKNQDKTEVNFGITENGFHLFVAAKCYTSNVNNLSAKNRLPDDKDILQDEHIELLLNTPFRSHFLVAVNMVGSVYDESFDLDSIHSNKKSILWSPRTRAFVKKYEDRLELEIAIPTEGFGYPCNSLNVPWGINVIRTGKNYSNVSALEPEGGWRENINPRKWRRLWKKNMDFDGAPLLPINFVVVCDNKRPEPYRVARARGMVDLTGEWDSPSWNYAKSVSLMPCMKKPGDRNIHYPDTQAKMLYDNEYIYVMFQVKDQYVHAIAKNDMDFVNLDSCVELFIRPANTPHYYNFEMNCGGKMLLCEIENGAAGLSRRFTPEVLKRIERFHTLPEIVNPEITQPVTWRVAYKIPLAFFVERIGIDPKLSGQIWTANFFKCADRSSHRHWMCWNPSPGFHCPDYFGKIIFE